MSGKFMKNYILARFYKNFKKRYILILEKYFNKNKLTTKNN